jgi:hypothetical protein
MVGGTASLPGQSGHHPKAKLAQDRDEKAVVAAMRQLDGCKLLSGYLQAHAGSVAIPNGAHSCLLASKADWTPLDPSMTLAVGEKLDHTDKLMMKPVAVDGVKAYVIDQSRDDRSSCKLTIPVSFELGVSVRETVDGKVDTCGDVQNVAKSVVAGLRAPDQNVLDPAKLPFATWDGCTFARGLLATQTSYDYVPNGYDDPFSGCHGTKKLSPGEYPEDNGVTLSVDYERWDTVGREGAQQISGKAATVAVFGAGGCQVRWNQGPSGTGNEWLGDVVFELVSENSCDVVKQGATKAIALAAQPAPADPAKPVRPLVYTTAEPDDAFAGACADFSSATGDDCQPYQAVPIPQTVQERTAQPAKDTNTLCAMFNDQVKAAFGPTLSPLTWLQHCFYVEPTHGVEIGIDLQPTVEPARFGDEPDLYADRKTVQLGGMQAVTFYNSQKYEYDIYLSLHNDIRRKGNLHLQVSTSSPRGVLSEATPVLDPAKATAADDVMAKVVKAYFS